MRIASLLLIGLLFKPLFSREFEITNRDVGIAFSLGQGPNELILSAGVLLNFEDNDNFSVPVTFEADFQWAQYTRNAFSIGFQSGVFTIFGFERSFGELSGVLDSYGINLLRLEPEVRITESTAVFLNLIIASFDFDEFDFLIGTFGPQSEIGLKLIF